MARKRKQRSGPIFPRGPSRQHMLPIKVTSEKHIVQRGPTWAASVDRMQRKVNPRKPRRPRQPRHTWNPRSR